MKIPRIKNIITACRQIAFPDVCVCCGVTMPAQPQLLCSWCKQQRFEHPPENNADILPSSVLNLHSLWVFDKGGYLQHLLHKLKYHHLGSLGKELGRHLGNHYMRSRAFQHVKAERYRSFLLIPVPLHKKKHRKRGYNQARAIAQGIAEVTGWQILPEEIIIRTKNTKTQTGLTAKQRSTNVKEAFEWAGDTTPDEYIPVLVDDVFTTGATTFELAGMIAEKTGKQSLILTLAKA